MATDIWCVPDTPKADERSTAAWSYERALQPLRDSGAVDKVRIGMERHYRERPVNRFRELWGDAEIKVRCSPEFCGDAGNDVATSDGVLDYHRVQQGNES